MKHFILAVLIGIIVLASTCKPKNDLPSFNGSSLTLLYDRTDTLSSALEVEKIKAIYEIQSNHERGAFFRATELSDVEYAKAFQFEVKPQSLLLSNPGERNNEIKHFFQNIDESVKYFQTLPIGKSNSTIYPVIAREANLLASQVGNSSYKKTLVVYSNLYENGDEFSMYKESDVSKLYRTPEQVVSIFEKQMPLGNLENIQLHIVYQARNYDDAKSFKAIANVYKKLFERHGAQVIISANL